MAISQKDSTAICIAIASGRISRNVSLISRSAYFTRRHENNVNCGFWLDDFWWLWVGGNFQVANFEWKW
jgi:hypothetical protein